MSETARKRPWVPNQPEQRLSIAVDRLLTRGLLQPCWFSAIHDQDGGKRTQQQRARDANRGMKGGQLDWDVVQGLPHIARKLELKRGKNGTTEQQDATIVKLTECGAPPVVAWTLREVYAGLAAAGFRFSGGIETVLQHLEAELAGWDREAEAIRSGEIVRKPSRKPRAAKPPTSRIRRINAVRARVMF